MQELNVGKAALMVGFFVGGAHLIWSILIALRWAQALVNFSAGLHMVTAPVQVLPFNLGTAFLLILIAFTVGYIGGRIFASIWNAVNKS